MYKGASGKLQTRRDRGLTQSGKSKVAKKGKPKSKVHVRLEAAAIDSQLATWQRYVENCRKNGTTAFVPADIRRRLGMED